MWAYSGKEVVVFGSDEEDEVEEVEKVEEVVVAEASEVADAEAVETRSQRRDRVLAGMEAAEKEMERQMEAARMQTEDVDV